MGILGDSVVEACKGYVSPSLQINDVCSMSACFSELELHLGDLGEVGSDPRPPQPESLLSVLTRTLGSEGTAVVAPAFPGHSLLSLCSVLLQAPLSSITLATGNLGM